MYLLIVCLVPGTHQPAHTVCMLKPNHTMCLFVYASLCSQDTRLWLNRYINIYIFEWILLIIYLHYWEISAYVHESY